MNPQITVPGPPDAAVPPALDEPLPGQGQPGTTGGQLPVRRVKLPNGVAAAALVAAGAGAFTMGLLTTLTEVSPEVGEALTWYGPVGPLSGKSTGAVLVWLIVWGVLHLVLRGRMVNFTVVFFVTLLLVGLGLLGTFPPFFYMVGGWF